MMYVLHSWRGLRARDIILVNKLIIGFLSGRAADNNPAIRFYSFVFQIRIHFLTPTL
jgi:hypothetical protein